MEVESALAKKKERREGFQVQRQCWRWWGNCEVGSQRNHQNLVKGREEEGGHVWVAPLRRGLITNHRQGVWRKICSEDNLLLLEFLLHMLTSWDQIKEELA